MDAILILVGGALVAAATVVEATRRRREAAKLERKLDRVLRRLGLDPDSGELVE